MDLDKKQNKIELTLAIFKLWDSEEREPMYVLLGIINQRDSLWLQSAEVCKTIS